MKKENEEIFRKLYERYKSKLYKFVYMKVENKSDIEDLIQETFIKVYNNFDSYDKVKGKFINFLFANASQVIIEYYRRNTSDADKEKLVRDKISLDDRKYFEIVDGEYGLSKFLDKLPEAQRKAVELVYVNELSYKHAALIMDRTESSIKSLIFRAKANLKKMIENENPEIVNQYLGRKVLKAVIVCMISVGMLTGITKAIIELYKTLNVKENTFTIQDVKQELTGYQIKITKEEAMDIIKKDLEIIKSREVAIDNVQLVKNYQLDKICWKYENDEFLIYIDADSGDFGAYYSFIENDDLCQKSYLEILSELKIMRNQEFCNAENILGVQKIRYAKKYNNIFNFYQSVLIAFEEDSLQSIMRLEIDYDENEILITKDEAIKLCNKNLSEIEKVEISIENILLNDKNRGDELLEYSTDYYILNLPLDIKLYDIRNVWKIENKNGEIILVDANTGKKYN